MGGGIATGDGWRRYRHDTEEVLERIYQGEMPPKYTEFKINLGLRKLHIIQAPAIA